MKLIYREQEMNFRIVALLVAITFLSGCASIVTGTQQSISVVAKSPESHEVIGASCSLSNTKGDWFTTTPGSVTVHRGYGVLTVKCDHPQWVGELEAKSTTKAMAFGNIVFGGAIGATVDIVNGSAYDYPQLITVAMQTKTASNPDAALAQPSKLPAAAASIRVVATAPSVASSASTGSAKAREGMTGGQDSFAASRLARLEACHTEPLPMMTSKGPGFETYTVACQSGDVLSMRCEYGNCRLLR